MPKNSYEDKQQLRNEKMRKKNTKKINTSPKKSLLEKESEFIKKL
ncbi:MAG: hypothetical protein ACFE85_08125 [Candidatus Hodarchaeota archaeon]